MARAPSPDKSERAFRTISEAAEIIGVPQHVLRFWETRFPQLQPLKRGGNRRYYRPADMALLETIRGMLHDRGLTIRGAKLALDSGEIAVAEPAAAPVATAPAPAAPLPLVEPDIPQVPIPAAMRPAGPAPVSTPAAPPAIDLAALKAIRDRLRLALAA
jgi:DNA-binding transcriptional MerR regulator